MSFALATLWHDRQRFLPGILAVAFSALLIALQCGLLMGLFSVTSITVDHTRADIWIGAPHVLSVDLGQPVTERAAARLADYRPEVVSWEIYVQSFGKWKTSAGGTELCMICGSRLSDDALGTVSELTPDLREKLTEPGAVVVDRSEFDRLGITGVGDHAEINGKRVRVVGLVSGLKGIAAPFVFCSIGTAHALTGLAPDQGTFLLVKCRSREGAAEVVKHLKGYDDMSSFTSQEFSLRSRIHWLTKTKAGVALGYAALLGLMVGAVVTSQTLYAATMAAVREYATLLALGIPRWRLAVTVLTQSLWVGVLGVAVALPASFLFGEAANLAGAKVMLPPVILGGAGVITLVMALAAGLMALRSLRMIEPVNLLR